MFIAIDVGNSNIHCGIFINQPQLKLIETKIFYAKQPLHQDFLKFITKHSNADGIIVSDAYGETSIQNNSQFLKIIKPLQRCIFIKPNSNCGLKINYLPKKSLGTDRLAACVAAYNLFQKDCLVIDFGTATTFNIVSKQGEFLGGLITPGINSLLQSFPNHLIKSIKFLSPFRPDEKNTYQAIKSGLYYLLIGLIEKVVNETEQILKTNLLLIATGHALKILPQLKRYFHKYDANLTLKGLALIYQKNKGAKYD